MGEFRSVTRAGQGSGVVPWRRQGTSWPVTGGGRSEGGSGYREEGQDACALRVSPTTLHLVH